MTTPLPDSFGPNASGEAVESFYRTYDELFGHHLTNVGVEALTWRLRATAPPPAPPVARRKNGSDPDRTGERTRRVYYPDIGEFHDVPVLDDSGLPVGRDFEGPALIEQSGCTAVVGPRERFSADGNGNLLISLPR